MKKLKNSKKLFFVSLTILGIISLLFALKLYTFYKSTYIKSKGEIMTYDMRQGGIVWNGENPPKIEYCLIFDIRNGFSPGIKDKTKVNESCSPFHED